MKTVVVAKILEMKAVGVPKIHDDMKTMVNAKIHDMKTVVIAKNSCDEDSGHR